MVTAVLLAAVLAGLFWPGLITNRKAFGIAAILVVAEMVAMAAGITSSMFLNMILHDHWRFGGNDGPGVSGRLLEFATMAAIFLKGALTVALLKAYWPGGSLLAIARTRPEPAAEEAKPES